MNGIRFVVTIAFALAAPLLAARAEPTTPARYLVFEVGPDDEISLVEIRDVEIAGRLETEDLRRPAHEHHEPAVSLRNPDEAVVTLMGKRGASFRRTISIDRELHVETVGESGEMVRRSRTAEKTAFTVLVPRDGHAIEVFRKKTSHSQSFDVEQSYTATAAAADLRMPASAKSPGNRVDLLVLGDGYTEAEASKFEADAAWAVRFAGMSPYDEYESYVNVVTHFVPSEESGADHPVCSDPYKAPDPAEGTFRKTAFDAAYCSFGLQRLLSVNQTKARSVAGAVFPDWDFLVVLVNDTFYGGAGSGRGGRILVSSVASAAPRVFKHEWGHTFTDLADEYTAPYPGYPDCNDAVGTPCEANITTQTERSLVKWRSWILGSTPVPTPQSTSFASRVGLFEGGRYHETGYHRPKLDCFMRSIADGVSFCEVCRQEYVLTLYRGWGGIPARGIELIEPGSATPAASTVSGHVGSAATFSATVLQPDRGPRASIRWEVDGHVQPSTTNSMTFTPGAPGSYSIRMIVTDPTNFVDGSAAGEELTASRSWTLVVGTARRRLVWR